MNITRRDFLRYCISSAAVLGLDASVVMQLSKALAQDNGAAIPTVIWLNGANCTGCTISLANRIGVSAPVDVADLLINTINLEFHPNLMAASGDLAVQSLRDAVKKGNFVLVMDGGVPTAFNGHACTLWTENGREVTAMEAVRELAAKSLANISVGTCASFGGIPAAGPNPTAIRSFSQASGKPTINIPGCPAHPDWIIWVVAQLIAGINPALDSYGRPKALYPQAIHKTCPRKETGAVKVFGKVGCLKELGCKGPKTFADCVSRKWNNATNWCIGANSLCIGCTESGFPDSFAPLYKVTNWNTSVSYNPENADVAEGNLSGGPDLGWIETPEPPSGGGKPPKPPKKKK